MPYHKQLIWKQKQINMLLGKFCKPEKIIGMLNPENYRNKLQAIYRVTKDGKIISGVYQSSNNGIVATDSCMLTDKEANSISATLKKLFLSFKIRPYNPANNCGLVKNVIIRCGNSTGEIMVVIIVSKNTEAFSRSFVNALVKAHPRIRTIAITVNSKNKLLNGTNEKIIYGDGKILTKICSCNFLLSPNSFFQVNSLQTEVLYSTAINFAELNKEDTVIDAYCGVGTIGIIAAKNVKNVFGVELNPYAVQDAKENAKLNDVQNISFMEDDSGNFMNNLVNNNKKIDVVFTDPPRSGCTIKFLNSLVKLSPSKIVYISCNPNTLERDLRFLNRFKYKVNKIQPIDMFPYTNHVETVVLISKVN